MINASFKTGGQRNYEIKRLFWWQSVEKSIQGTNTSSWVVFWLWTSKHLLDFFQFVSSFQQDMLLPQETLSNLFVFLLHVCPSPKKLTFMFRQQLLNMEQIFYLYSSSPLNQSRPLKNTYRRGYFNLRPKEKVDCKRLGMNCTINCARRKILTKLASVKLRTSSPRMSLNAIVSRTISNVSMSGPSM